MENYEKGELTSAVDFAFFVFLEPSLRTFFIAREIYDFAYYVAVIYMPVT